MSEQVPVRAIDKVVAHYKATKGRRHAIETAWGFTVWVSPWLLGEQDLVFGEDPRFRPRSNARLLIVKAEDEKGKRLFADLDETELLSEADPTEVVRVAGAMLALLNADRKAADGDDAPKASAPPPPPGDP